MSGVPVILGSPLHVDAQLFHTTALVPGREVQYCTLQYSNVNKQYCTLQYSSVNKQ